jgi:hypothetical protein
MRLAVDQPALLEGGEHPRHRGRLHLLVLRQGARSHRPMPIQRRQRRELRDGQRQIAPLGA